ncbi:hypothetical protein LINPERPRIM_LOCUS35588 [Linum perenne]
MALTGTSTANTGLPLVPRSAKKSSNSFRPAPCLVDGTILTSF